MKGLRFVFGLIGVLLFTLPACNTAEQNKTPLSQDDVSPALIETREQKSQKPLARPERMFRMTLKITDKGVEILNSVEAPNTINRRDPYKDGKTIFRVFDKNNAVLVERGFRMEKVLRSEWEDEQGNLRGATVPLDEVIISVAIPKYEQLEVVRLYKRIPDNMVHGQAAEESDLELIGEVRP
ncbi:MAG: hypothetical protein GY847_01010 [Proteobacteria bacterium]|nr:hypothetical protein [Pseudomonadota bacterium]